MSKGQGVKWVLVALAAVMVAGWFVCGPVSLFPTLSIRPGDMAGEGVFRISDSLFLYKTSAVTYSLGDADGFGLVQGNVVRIRVTMPGELVVGYVPFDRTLPNDLEAIPFDTLRFARARLSGDGRLESAFFRVPLDEVNTADLLSVERVAAQCTQMR